MLADEWLAVIKAERERDIRMAQRAHLVERDRMEDEAVETASTELGQSLGRIVRPAVQPGRATADRSL